MDIFLSLLDVRLRHLGLRRLVIVILLGHAFLLQQDSITLGRRRREFGVALRDQKRGAELLQRRFRLRQRGLRLRDLGVQIRRIDLDEKVAFFDVIADVDRPLF